MAHTHAPEDIEALRRLLMEALTLAPFDGWTNAMLDEAMERAGLDPIFRARVIPNGVSDLIEFWVMDADRLMLADLLQMDLGRMKIRERIAAAVWVRLERQAPHREALRRALNLLAMPQYAALNLRTLYRTVDAIWRGIGDASTDWNFYTKRMLLGGVYSATLFYWLNDNSEGFVDTRAFLDRRIQDVMQIQKTRARVEGFFNRCGQMFGLRAG